MLTIKYHNGTEFEVRNDDFSKLPDTKGIKEIYVDGDELGSFLGMSVSTHGARGITMSGQGLDILLGYHLSKSLNKLDEEDEVAAHVYGEVKIVVLDPNSPDPTWGLADGAEIWEVEYPEHDINTVHDFIVHSKTPIVGE